MQPNLHPSGIFVTELAAYYQPAPLFFYLFERFPSKLQLQNIKYDKLHGQLCRKYKGLIKEEVVKEVNHSDNPEYTSRSSYLIFENELMIHLDEYCSKASVLFTKENRKMAERIFNMIKKISYEKKSEEKEILVIVQNMGLSTQALPVGQVNVNIGINYNDDALPMHEELVELLNKNEEGLGLFYGEPGTGKTTFLRHAITQTKRQVLFLSPKLAGSLDAPAFTQFLIDMKECVLLIEDAEDLLISREKEGNSMVSALLNITDGIIGKSLKILVLCTFNTALRNIDTALLRKGRLKLMYEFKPLETSKCKAFLKTMDKSDTEVTQPMTLAELYNIEATTYNIAIKPKAIGFSTR